MKLVSVSYEQSRLNFFRGQLAAANRRLDWSMKHNPDWYDHSERRSGKLLRMGCKDGGERGGGRA